MRTIGNIPHPKYKITVLEHNNKIKLQIESGLFTQSYTFRDGSTISDFNAVKAFCTEAFLEKTDLRFKSMSRDYIEQLSSAVSEDFPKII